jgi:hypothetical protein
MPTLICVICGKSFYNYDHRTKTCSPECCTARLKQHAKEHNNFTGRHEQYPKRLEWCKSHSGVNSPTFGKPHSTEIRTKISAALKGNPALKKPKSLVTLLKRKLAITNINIPTGGSQSFHIFNSDGSIYYFGKHLSKQTAKKNYFPVPKIEIAIERKRYKQRTPFPPFSLVKSCPYCITMFTVTDRNKKEQKYCSRKCYSAVISLQMKGSRNPTLGKGHNEIAKAKMRQNHYDSSGVNNGRWLGGKSFEPYNPIFNKRLKEMIRKRDNYECQICSTKQNGRKLNIHHIDYDKQNNIPPNLASLCDSCHTKTNTKRKYWIEYFNNIRMVKQWPLIMI